MKAHPDIDGDARVAVQSTIVITSRTLVGVVATIHLAGWLIRTRVSRRVRIAPGMLVAVVVKQAEIHVLKKGICLRPQLR